MPISHSDFDLSFRLEDLGLRLVYTPFAELRHLGNQSRGSARTTSESRVRRADGGADAYMLARWGERMASDPFYPSGMRQLLYEDASDYQVDAPPATPPSDAWWDLPRILLVSHDLSLSGAPLMLLEVARALSEAGMLVVISSPVRGPLGEAVRDAGIPLFIDEYILTEPSRADRSLLQFDLVVAGTVHGCRVIERASVLGKRTVWFVQEAAFGLDLVRRLGASRAFARADSVVFPSEHAARVFDAFDSGRNAVIRYGIPDPRDRVISAAAPGSSERGTFRSYGRDRSSRAKIPKCSSKRSECWRRRPAIACTFRLQGRFYFLNTPKSYAGRRAAFPFDSWASSHTT